MGELWDVFCANLGKNDHFIPALCWYGTDNWDFSSWKTRTHLSYHSQNHSCWWLCETKMSGQSQPWYWPSDCFTNVLWALQNNLAKIHYAWNHIYGENFKLTICTYAQSMALDTRTKCQLEILTGSTLSAIHNFWENILESSRDISETTPKLIWKMPASASEEWSNFQYQH